MPKFVEIIYGVTNGSWPDRAVTCRLDDEVVSDPWIEFYDDKHQFVASIPAPVGSDAYTDERMATRSEFEAYAFRQQVLDRMADSDQRASDDRKQRVDRFGQCLGAVAALVVAFYLLPIIFKIIF